MTEYILSFLNKLIDNGASLYRAESPQPIHLGAAEWLPGHGLMIAELGAEHQGHVHLIPAATIETDGDSPEIDLASADGEYMATILPDEDIPTDGLQRWIALRDTEDWQQFWRAEIALRKGDA
jgi:hypothetical protein